MESDKAHMQEALQADGLTEIVYLAIWRDPQTGVPDVLWQVSNGLETVRGWWCAAGRAWSPVSRECPPAS
jgi:hypothetical protein